jgi:hypothetical protein
MKKTKKLRQARPAQRPIWFIPAIIVGILAVVLAAIALITSNRNEAFEPEVTGAPRAEVEPTSIDHGTKRYEQPVESVFRIRNVGDQPLLILGEPRVQLIEGC